MLEANCWYKVVDKANRITEVFAVGAIFKVLNVNAHVVKLYSPTKDRNYHIIVLTFNDIRTVKLDSKAAELLYGKAVV